MDNFDRFVLGLTFFVLVFIVLLGTKEINRIQPIQQTISTEVVADPGVPYNIQVLNDHDVLLTMATDTIKLAFENAYNLSDEYVVYVMKY